MKPIKLKIKGLNSFQEEQVIDFIKLTDRGLFGIFGPTGSGKSTVLDGITLALYGNMARKSSNFINTNCERVNVYFEFQMPAVIGVYWVFRNILSTLQRILLSKMIPTPKFTEEDYKEAERQANMSNKQKKREAKEGEKKFVRSLHHIDDEEYLARHAEDLKALEGETDSAPVGNTTEAAEDPDAKMAPAPIKNDEKTQYKSKKKSDK